MQNSLLKVRSKQPSGAPADPPTRLHDLLTRWRQSGLPALDGKDGELTYAQMNYQAQVLAARATKVGLSSGGRCAIFLPKGQAECWAVFAVSMAGGIIVPVNPLLKAAQLAHICSDCTPQVLITNAKMLEPVRAAIDALESPPQILLLEGLAEQDKEQHLPPAALPSASDPELAQLPTLPGDQRLTVDLAAILYTSGSTGRPKGVMLTHANLLAGTRIVRNYLNIGPNDRLLSVLPLSFDYGLNQLLTTVEQQALLVPFSFMFGDQLVTALERHRITGLAGVPTIWAILTQAAPKLRKTELTELRYITNSGGPVPSSTVARLREYLPHTQVYLMYGLTEAFRSTFLDPAELDTRPTSIGKAIPECEVFVLKADGSRAAPGEPGILIHRGPTVSKGYWRRPEDSARVLRANPLIDPTEGPDTVCYSGDLVMSDEQGFLFFVGRDDAMIKSSGYRISPAEVEETLMAGGHFSQVAVIGLPDPAAGQRVYAIAVAAPGQLTSDIDAAALCAIALKAATKILPAYMIPRQIELLSELPVTPNGKVDHKTLRTERLPTHD